jgi:type II secretory pathway pseudopilin PulG
VSTAAVIVVVVVAVLLLLALGGAAAQRRRMRAGDQEFRARVRQANADLAAAHAQDRGWEPGRLEAAARRAFTDRHPGVEIESIDLVQVVDRPGTDEDEAVLVVVAGGERHEVRLGRRGDEWIGA